MLFDQFPLYPGDSHASVLCSALRADFVGCALHASADAVARNDMNLQQPDKLNFEPTMEENL